MLPKEFKLDFIVAGAQKSGTSVIDHYLKEHPEIAMGKTKELHFFDDEELFKGLAVDYEALHKQIELKEYSKICGECTPIYMYWNPSMERIWEYNPEIKIISILRNPIDRAFSHWNMEVNRNAESMSFWDCVNNEQERVKEALPFQHRVYSYVDRGFYSWQIERIYRFFKRKQVLLLKYEDFYSNQENELNKIFDFLGVNRKSFVYNKALVNRTEYQAKMTMKEKNFLMGLYENDIKKVENITGWNCNDWRV